jgi:predicted 2-oxoglutarate/Fe(II)-dependent dioxygenase YbiX
MQNHCDHIYSLFDGKRKGIPVLSIIGILNDDYDGGELIMLEDKKIDTKKGDLLIFPSNFLYPHQITPVTKGVRYSYVSWVW